MDDPCSFLKLESLFVVWEKERSANIEAIFEKMKGFGNLRIPHKNESWAQSTLDEPTDWLSRLCLLTRAGTNWYVASLQSRDLTDSAAQMGNVSTVINLLYKGQNQESSEKYSIS